MAALPSSRACVKVSPPLLASVRFTPAGVLGLSVPCVNATHAASSDRLPPADVIVLAPPVPQLPAVVPTRLPTSSTFVTVIAPALLAPMPPP
jgi:hypothetical protein